jgi:RNA polymerase sigma factor (sigma-70 family)
MPRCSPFAPRRAYQQLRIDFVKCLFPTTHEEAKATNGTARPIRTIEELVLSCVGLCKKLARQFAPVCDSPKMFAQRVEEYTLEANLACVECANGYKPEGSAEFSTVAHSYISKRLQRLKENDRLQTGMIMETYPDSRTDPANAEDEPIEVEPIKIDTRSNDLLLQLNEPARSLVRLMLFENLTRHQAGEQLGMKAKDIELALRNATTQLIRIQRTIDAPRLPGLDYGSIEEASS